jgi:hypothetical protein
VPSLWPAVMILLARQGLVWRLRSPGCRAGP